ncbi:SDR family NAD(P)-dependent oxidoreductase [Candidatus Fonsibacter ubiquis]|uniref:SDR family NAD(P)-dependent oxidoreductase n=1 Tax=Candidatus Fonsibacter ubiquis TaxID=1925548 RepID=UPI000C086ED3|nr:SDR family oxidoreductase [Candidatus Fonsibacter ubiquis]
MLKNKNILITGIGKGIGKELFFECIKLEANVYAVCKNKKDLQEFKFNKKKIKIFFGDVTNNKFVSKIFDYFLKKKIKLDGLVNNAGQRQRLPFEKIDRERLDHIMNVNFFSIFFIIQKFIKTINKNKESSIVNIGSIVGNKGFEELSGYASSKSALEGLTKCLAVELTPKFKKLRINNVNPGFTRTSFYSKFKNEKKSLYNWTLKKIPIGRWGEAKEISKLIIFLLSNNSTYINGQSINIDGGWTAS